VRQLQNVNEIGALGFGVSQTPIPRCQKAPKMPILQFHAFIYFFSERPSNYETNQSLWLAKILQNLGV